ncbi:MAG: branched-chain amino acid aminotransferase [Oligoflexia bacterium]|nr:branched-chain amino acid aminotransferase [Oligoflexia bacterium]
MLKIEIKNRLPTPQYPQNPKFGTQFTPHLLQIDLQEGQTDFNAVIRASQDTEPFRASTVVLHYGQSIFEGMKAFRQKNNTVAIFRADLHAKRFMHSARMLAMPEIGEDVFLQALKEYVRFEKESVPQLEDHALYLRPLMIARDEIVKVGKSKKYSFYILGCVVGSYFSGGQAKPAKVMVCKEFVRAVPGGLGEAKTAANYAASLAPQAFAEKHGCDQVLYLDGIEHKFVDELGGMNFFIVRNGNELCTPKLNGSILHGVTRQSILEIANSLGLKPKEEKLSFDEILEQIKSGVVTEAFACGTAAVIHSIGEFLFLTKKSDAPNSIKLPSETPVGQKLLSELKQIQRGIKKAPGQWLTLIE